MTLHMTLTRPDLRTTDEGRHPDVVGEDPLRLSALPFSDEHQPIWDSLPPDGSRIRRLWRRLRK